MENAKLNVILFVRTIDKSGGGLTTYIQQLASELKNLIKITIVTSRSTNPVEIPDIEIRNVGMGLWRWFGIKKDFDVILREVKPDIVHINGLWDPQNYLFQKVAQKLGITIILSPHGMLEPFILQRNPLKKKLALMLYQHNAINAANFIHTTAQSELDQIRKLGFNNKAVIIPNGLEISDVSLPTRTSEKEYFTVLFLSRIHPKKGIEILIRAFHNFKNENVRLVIAGEGESRYVKNLQRILKKSEVEQQVSFIGGVYGGEKWSLYQNADLFVLPTYSENFGIVVIEALAAGLPVITTKGTPWEELRTHNCGWWIDLTVDHLTAAINEAMSKTPVELQEMGARGKKLVESKYDIKMVAKETLQFYRSVFPVSNQ